MSRPKAWMSWSTGKDSAWALKAARSQGFEIVALLSTLNAQFKRVAMHGVREELLDAQAEALGLPLVISAGQPWSSPSWSSFRFLLGSISASGRTPLTTTIIAWMTN